MLTTIRSKATSIVSYVLIGLLCLSFALFGIQNYIGGAADNTVASVAGQDIKQSAYENQIRTVENQFRQQFGSDVAGTITQNNEFRQSILNNMIDSILLTEMVADYNYSASDRDLANYIVAQPSFQNENGEFDQELYERLLTQNGINVESYEASQRSNVALDIVQRANAYISDFTPTKIENKVITLMTQERDIDYMVLPLDAIKTSVTDEEIQAYYEAHQNEYLSAERIKLDYVRISREDFAQDIEISDAEISDYYEINKSRFAKAEERTVRHILVQADTSENNDQKKAALDKAISLQQEIAAGADFAKVAGASSDDKGSAINGGNLGVINKGVTVPAFEEAVFALEVNVVSDPVETEFGFHLIEVTNLVAESGKPLSEVKDEIAKTIASDNNEAAYAAQVERLQNIAFENPDLLQPIADEFNTTVQTSEWLERQSNEGLLANEEIKALAFSEDFILDSFNSDAIVGDQVSYVIRKNEYQAAEVQALESIKDTITASATTQKQKRLLTEKSDSVVAELIAGANWNTVVSANNASSVKAPVKKSAVENEQEFALAEAAFSQPYQDATAFGHTEFNDDSIIYQINSVKFVENITDLFVEERTAVRTIINNYQQGNAMPELIETLRANATIDIDAEAINIY